MNRQTALESCHDVALALWGGGALMGAIGLDAAAERAFDPDERLRLSAVGWEWWTPVAAVAIVTHCALDLGASLMPSTTRFRRTGTHRLLNAAVTVAAITSSAYSDLLLGTVQAESFRASSPGVDKRTLARAQRRLAAVHWATPMLTAVLIVMRSTRATSRQ